MTDTKRYFFCGIGGSGMLPLATILRAQGHEVHGSDRSSDQGTNAAKFRWLRDQGMTLFPQDGSGVVDAAQIVVASAAVESTVPDIVQATALGCARLTRAQLLAQLFNAATTRIAVGGTSGKSTVTGMIGWIAQALGKAPTVMNGAVMKNFANADAPFASALVGDPGLFISEVDESDGSIALFAPSIAVLNNISLDHKTLAELHQLFGDFAAKAQCAIWNADDAESRALFAARPCAHGKSFGFAEGADYRATDIVEEPTACRFHLVYGGDVHTVTLAVPGRHNIANALAAIAAGHAAGWPLADVVAAIGGFAGLRRRFEIVGTSAGGVTVIDDFGHNPDKIAATISTLRAFPGRLLLFFQPHGYGPLRVMGQELVAMFTEHLTADDVLILSDPVYFGGTVDRSTGSSAITDPLIAAGKRAEHIPARDDCGARLAALAQRGDRIVIMGARDDTLPGFAAGVLAQV